MVSLICDACWTILPLFVFICLFLLSVPFVAGSDLNTQQGNGIVAFVFGISSEFVNIEDRTFIENSKFIYRFGFDIEISSKEVITREMNRIESIEPIKYEEEQIIWVNIEKV